METLEIRQPDNWHAHLREDQILMEVAPCFNPYGRVLCMGNTSPLIETAEDARCYRAEILAQGVLFKPVMTIMLTENTTPAIIIAAAEAGIKFVKFIPRSTSVGAVKGLRLDDFDRLSKIFPIIQETGLHLLIHAELISFPDGRLIHPLKREEEAVRLIASFHMVFPNMKITIEHASTAAMINFIEFQDSPNLRATLTPHHALLTYEDAFDENDRLINPANYCLPVLKREKDRQTVIRAMMSGDERFFAGADSAPHLTAKKKGDNPPPGIFFGPAEIPLWAQIFEQAGQLGRLEDFTSRFGAEYYGFPLNPSKLVLMRKEWELPEEDKNGICFGWLNEKVRWRVMSKTIGEE